MMPVSQDFEESRFAAPPAEPDMFRVSFAAILGNLRRTWYLPLVLPLLLFALLSLYMAARIPVYEASMTVAPSGTITGQEQKSTSISSLLGGLDQRPKEYDLFFDVLKSQAVADYLVQAQQFDRVLFADRWDEQSQNWRPKRGLNAALSRLYRQAVYGLEDAAPTPSDVRTAINQMMNVTHSRNLSVIKVVHNDPATARRYLEQIVRAADLIMKQRIREYSTEKMAYLSNRLNNAALNVEHRASLIKYMMSIEQNMLLLTSDLPAVFEIIEPARADDRPKMLSLTLSVLISVAAGLFVTLAWAFGRALATGGRA